MIEVLETTEKSNVSRIFTRRLYQISPALHIQASDIRAISSGNPHLESQRWPECVVCEDFAAFFAHLKMLPLHGILHSASQTLGSNVRFSGVELIL